MVKNICENSGVESAIVEGQVVCRAGCNRDQFVGSPGFLDTLNAEAGSRGHEGVSEVAEAAANVEDFHAGSHVRRHQVHKDAQTMFIDGSMESSKQSLHGTIFASCGELLQFRYWQLFAWRPIPILVSLEWMRCTMCSA